MWRGGKAGISFAELLVMLGIAAMFVAILLPAIACAGI
jgi:hypothetical protein